MGTAGRTAPLGRTGSLLGLLGLEVAAVLGLHWLGRFAGLRIGWDEPVPWLLNSPIQHVFGSVLRMVALVMAYWLLASTVAYLLASLTRLPGAVRAVGWATLPLVRRVADHAVAVTLATSMVGGTTLGVAGPALAADPRGFGPPAPKPAAAAGATELGAQDGPATTEPEPTRTSEPVYTPDPADQAPTTAPQATPPPPTTEPEPTRTSEPVYTPDPADQVPRRLQEEESTTTTADSTTTTAEATTTTTTEPPTTTAEATTTTAEATTTTAEATTTTAEATTTTARPPTTTTAAAPTTAAPATRQGTAAPTSGPTTSTARRPGAGAAAAPGRDHAYDPEPASDPPEAAEANPGSGTPANPGGGNDQGRGEREERTHRVVGGDSLWMIARDHLSRQRSGGSGRPTNREVAAYWIKVVEANRDRLQSGDPDLIYPGERVKLPPVD